MSHVMCHMSRVTCHMSRVTCHLFFSFLTTVEAYRWRVCYQRGLPNLVFIKRFQISEIDLSECELLSFVTILVLCFITIWVHRFSWDGAGHEVSGPLKVKWAQGDEPPGIYKTHLYIRTLLCPTQFNWASQVIWVCCSSLGVTALQGDRVWGQHFNSPDLTIADLCKSVIKQVKKYNILYRKECTLVGDNYKWWWQNSNFGDTHGCLGGKYNPFGKKK